ncbi:hypothetical protein, partial [Catenulispora pinisilvae]|uniref:hypothetical protein n=1 Tax=Catenulispora pinisilvae TaxID=2705253 RepID=UPI001891450A
GLLLRLALLGVGLGLAVLLRLALLGVRLTLRLTLLLGVRLGLALRLALLLRLRLLGVRLAVSLLLAVGLALALRLREGRGRGLLLGLAEGRCRLRLRCAEGLLGLSAELLLRLLRLGTPRLLSLTLGRRLLRLALGRRLLLVGRVDRGAEALGGRHRLLEVRRDRRGVGDRLGGRVRGGGGVLGLRGDHGYA